MEPEEEFEETNLTQDQLRLQMGLNRQGRPIQQVIFYELTTQIKQQAQQQINKDAKYMTAEQYQKITHDSAKTWDKFYKNHKCNFFKDRKYLEKQIPELTLLRERFEKNKEMSVFVELGCGVGNTLFPIHNQFEFLRLYGCDFANSAIKLIDQEIEANKPKFDRIKVEVCDLVKDQVPKHFEPGDLVTLIFVLSAIAPEQHQNVIQKIYDWMKPDSYFYFRDYGRYDFGQLNMSRKGNRKLKDNFYAKNDGVCVYYFEQEEIEGMCKKVGFELLKFDMHCKLLQNRKTGLKMYRVWMQARFYKPKVGDAKEGNLQWNKAKVQENQKESLEKIIKQQPKLEPEGSKQLPKEPNP